MNEQVLVRPLEVDDLPRVKEWLNSPDISRIMGYLPVLSNHEQLMWYEGIKKLRTSYVFAICVRETGEHIGNIGLGMIDYMSRHGMLNIFIAAPQHRGKGRGQAAVCYLLDFAFNRLNLNKVYLQTSPSFVEAIRMYKRLGFTAEGAMRQHYYCDGNYSDKLLFSMLRSEFEKSPCSQTG